MEHHVWLTVLGISGLLTLAVLVWPLANKLNFPYTVMLAAVGCAIGYVEYLIPQGASLGIASDLLNALHTLDITSETVLFIFLPALVFESALAIDVRRLMEDIAPIMVLAVIGLLISTAIVGWSLHLVSGVTLIACLLLGAIVSATDPVAVVAIFKDLGAPKRLAILVEGESLFNDATAIVVFTILSAMLLGQSDAGVVAGALSFVKVFFGGIVVGYILARIFCALMGAMGESALPKITLSLALAYLSFLGAEHYLHVSGVMAVVTASLVLGARGRSILSRSAWHELEGVWEQVGFVANSVIFVLVGLAVPSILGDFGSQQVLWLCVLLVTAFSARFALIFGLVPLLSRIGWAQHVGVGYRSVMFWGGLRGAVSLALALAVIENDGFAPEIRSFVGTLVTAFVLFTLAINATTVQFVMRAFGLDKLSPVDAAVRNRALGQAMANISDQLHAAAEGSALREGLADQVSEPYLARANARREENAAAEIGHDDWLKVGLKTLTMQEQQRYAAYFDQGLVSSEIARQLFARANDLLDGIKAGGLEGYRRAYQRSLGFGWQVVAAAQVQRKLGVAAPLARRLADRFEVLQSNCMAMRELLKGGLSSDVVAPAIADELQSILDSRLAEHSSARECLRAAYPEYALRLEESVLSQTAVRLEAAHYKRMLGASIIGKEVYHDLVTDLLDRAQSNKRPTLDLGLEADRLVAEMPFFAGLSPAQQHDIARMLKPRLVLPGEQIINQGERGDCMYFISSGAAKVHVQPEPVILGSGDFFGEMALLQDVPRKVSVSAEGFCDLLTLQTRDFRALLDAHPDLRATIESVAQARG